MELTSKRNFLFILAAILVVAMGIMALTLTSGTRKNKSVNYDTEMQNIIKQDSSSEIEDIEEDLMETDLDQMDTELQNLESELNSL